MHVNAQRDASASQPQRVAVTDPRPNNRPPRPIVNTGQSSISHQTPTPGPTPSSSLSAAQPPVQSPGLSAATQAQTTPSESDDFGSTLAKFIESHTTLHVKRQEKENLENHLATRRKFTGYYEAKQGPSNPWIHRMYQASKNTDDVELRTLNKALSNHAETSRQFTEALQKYRLPAATEGDSIAELRAEFKSEINSLRQSTPSKSQAPGTLEERFERLSASVNTQSQNYRKLQGLVREQGQWKADIEEGTTMLPPSAFPADLNSIQRDTKSNHEQCQKAGEDIKKLQQDYSAVKTIVDNVKSELDAHDLKKNIDEMRTSMSQFHSTVDSLSRIESRATGMIKDLEAEMKVGAKHLGNQLESAVSAQNTQFKSFEQRLNRLHDGSNPLATVSTTGTQPAANSLAADASFAIIPTVDPPVAATPAPNVPTASASIAGLAQIDALIARRVSAFDQAIAELRDSNEKMESTYRDLYTGVNPVMQNPVIQKGTGWVEEVERCMKTTQRLLDRTEVLTTSHRSLEYRYNNINSETMVRKMVNVIQEMYPSVSTLIEQIRALQEARQSQVTEVASLRAEMSNLNPDSRPAQLEQTLSDRIASLKDELTGQYTQRDNEHSQQIKSALDAVAKRGEDLESRLQALPNSAGHLSEQISNQIKSLEEAQQFQGEQVEQISGRVHALQAVQRGESSANAKNLEQINILRGRFDIQQTAVENLGELGDKYAEDIATLNEQMQTVEDLKSKLEIQDEQLRGLKSAFETSELTDEGYKQQFQAQNQRIDGLESPVQTLKTRLDEDLTLQLQDLSQRVGDLASPMRTFQTRLDELQAFGTAAEISAFCDQLRSLKQEDIVAKVTKLNDLLSERIVSYHAEVEGGQTSTSGNHEPAPGSSKATTRGSLATSKPVASKPAAPKPAAPKPATSQPNGSTQVHQDSTSVPQTSVPSSKGATQLRKSARPNPVSNAPPPPAQTPAQTPLSRPDPVSTDNSSSETPDMQTAQAGAKRKRLSIAPSESNEPSRQVSTPSQVSSSALSGADQSSRKKRKSEAHKKKERRRQSQLHQ